MKPLPNAAVSALRRLKRTLMPPEIPESDGFPIDAWTDPAYADWFDRHKATTEELAEQAVSTFEHEPVFSIVVPLFRTPLSYLDDMVGSVLAQTYPYFQLVLVNASPEIRALNDAARGYSESDPRITIVELDGNLGITENTNAGIEESIGDYICFLDHDDIVEPDLLYEYACAIANEPDAGLIYCDEDLFVSEDGETRLLHPLFKPDFSPELLLCKNYVVHMLCVSRKLIDGMPRPGSVYDGAQDYNMTLRAASSADKVCHIAKVLYHWRISEASTAANPHAKPYSRYAYRRSAYEHMLREGIDGDIVHSGIINIHNIWFAGSWDASSGRHAKQTHRISVVVPYANIDDASRFLCTLEENGICPGLQVVMVGSFDVSEEIAPLSSGLDMKAVYAEEGACIYEKMNKGAAEADGEVLVFVESDSFFLTADPLVQLASFLDIGGVGIVGPKTLYSDVTNKCYGIGVTSQAIMPLYRGYDDDFPGYQCNLRAFQDASAVSRNGLAINRALFEDIGGFDTDFGSEIGAVDICKRVRDLGYRISVTPTVKLQTGSLCEGERYSRGSEQPDFPNSEIMVYDRKWPGSRSLGDPYINPNLDQSSPYFQLPQPLQGQE